MKGNMIEAVMGAVVLIVAAVFLLFAYNTSQLKSVDGYSVSADFQRIDGIRDGGDVRISGIKVGSVVSETLNPRSSRPGFSATNTCRWCRAARTR